MYNRKNLKYITEDDLYFSLLRGSGVYCWNNITDNDPVDVSGRTSCPGFYGCGDGGTVFSAEGLLG